MGWLPMMSWILASACIKPTPPRVAAEATSVRLTAVVESYDEVSVVVAPDDVVALLTAELVRRNLSVAMSDADLAVFEGVRSTEGRLGTLARDDAGMVLLVELAPRFSAQVNGRYRWSVDVRASLGPEDVLTDHFQVPVHLWYDHQGESDAVIEASAVLGRHVGRLLDEWIGLQPLR